MNTANVTVDLSKEIGPIKIMNAVNNGPSKARSDQTRSNFADYKALEIPYARLHDSPFCSAYGGPHTVDITCIFPDFSKDANDPASYDFMITDEYLDTIRRAGTEPFFRLGQSIEHWIKKYGVNPPPDFQQWAAICEHIIRHYNEGWADGFHWNLQYWEIWNEPDGLPTADGRPSAQWTGTEEQFFELYSITATHLKKCFPKLKIGGPSHGYRMDWLEHFLSYLRAYDVPMDFFSWHRYATDPRCLKEHVAIRNAMLAKYGYGEVETILNEWNYVRGWSDEWVYSLRVESGDLRCKGAAFEAAYMSVCQEEPVDMLMFYDARLGTQMNNMFDNVTLEPLPGYYPFLAWAKMRRLGTQAAAAIDHAEDLFVTAATDLNGKAGILVTRYNDNDNISAPEIVKVKINGRSLEGALCHLTDNVKLYTQILPEADEAGAISIVMKPNSFVFIEI